MTREHWARYWINQLKHHPYRLVFVLWLLCAPSLFVLISHLIEQNYERQVSQSIASSQATLEKRAQLVEYDLRMIMSRFKELPHFLATHDVFIDTLSHPSSAERVSQANTKLHNIAHFLSVDLITLIDNEGKCIAASNHDSERSVVGADLSDRRYVQLALAGQSGQQYSVGRVTALPGFYFSAPVYAQKNSLKFESPIGMIATKLNMTQFLQQIHLDKILLVDEQSHIIYAQDTSWLGRRLIDQSHSSDKGITDEEVVIARSDFAHPQLKMLAGMTTPLLITKVERPDHSFYAYLFEPIPELLPLRDQHNVYHPFVLISSLLLLWALLASLVLTRRSQLDRHDVHEKNHELTLLNQQLKRQAETDFLTGCLNRRYFDKTLRELIAGSTTSTHLCLALFDVDHFKQVNDRYGHDFGDKALQHISGFVREHMHNTDILSRIGGEEFTLIMPNTSLDEAATRLERIRSELAITPLRDQDLVEPVTVTISIGLTQFLANDNVSKILQRADHAMYHAKQNGRNQTFIL